MGPGGNARTSKSLETAVSVCIDIAPLYVGHGLRARIGLDLFAQGTRFPKTEDKRMVHERLIWKCDAAAGVGVFIRPFCPHFRERLSACNHGGLPRAILGSGGVLLNGFLFKPKQKVLHSELLELNTIPPATVSSMTDRVDNGLPMRPASKAFWSRPAHVLIVGNIDRLSKAPVMLPPSFAQALSTINVVIFRQRQSPSCLSSIRAFVMPASRRVSGWPVGMTSEVARALTKMLPGDGEAWFGLANCECRLGHLSQARDIQLLIHHLNGPGCQRKPHCRWPDRHWHKPIRSRPVNAQRIA
jgi:hypothetical protein